MATPGIMEDFLRLRAKARKKILTTEPPFSCFEAFILTYGRSFERRPYPRTAERGEKNACFKNAWWLAMTSDYAQGVSEEAHVANIQRLANQLTAKHREVLAVCSLADNAACKMRIGHAQKALNLYLKYLWCLGEIPEPPHCPIDSIVLSRVPGCQDVRWTRIASPDEYRHIIEAAKTASKGVSLAQWELSLYNVALTNCL